ncbi:MAG: VWA domain-containing protein, partial [Myxococcales bacterium FL481]
DDDATGDDDDDATGDDDDVGDDDDSSGTGDELDCAQAEVLFVPQQPTVLLLIDQSGSMTRDFDSGVSRWDSLRAALLDTPDGIVPQLELAVRFGLAMYTSFDGNDGGTCPVLTEVPAKLSNFFDIREAFDDADPEDETPTGEALAAVAQSLGVDSTPGDKVIVLATDGAPDTCEAPQAEAGQAVAVAAVTDAHNAGITTFIISVGDEIGDVHLQEMANAGQGVPEGEPDAAFYKATDSGALVGAFEEIVNGLRECVFELDRPVEPGFEHTGLVAIGTDQLVKDDPDGWVLVGDSHVELVGDACKTIQEGEVLISVEFDCEHITPK